MNVYAESYMIVCEGTDSATIDACGVIRCVCGGVGCEMLVNKRINDHWVKLDV